MKITELIKQLQEIHSRYGDLDCIKTRHDPNDFEIYALDPDVEVVDNPCGDGKVIMMAEE